MNRRELLAGLVGAAGSLALNLDGCGTAPPQCLDSKCLKVVIPPANATFGQLRRALVNALVVQEVFKLESFANHNLMTITPGQEICTWARGRHEIRFVVARLLRRCCIAQKLLENAKNLKAIYLGAKSELSRLPCRLLYTGFVVACSRGKIVEPPKI